MDENIHLEDGSNDKAYFTMVPNIVLNHSSAVDQALYMQMKRFAGEKRGGSYCSASHRTLMEKLHIGPKALKASIAYLLEHKWIENTGSRKVMTPGGLQEVQIYRVNDIWRMNIEHYKGAYESAPLHEGGDESTQGADERSQGGDESATTKNIPKTLRTLVVAEAPTLLEVSSEEGDTERPRKKKVTNEMQQVFDLFTDIPARFQWKLYESERVAAQILFDEYGVTELTRRYAIARKYRGEEMCPLIKSPSTFLEKMPNMAAFLKQKNS